LSHFVDLYTDQQWKWSRNVSI